MVYVVQGFGGVTLGCGVDRKLWLLQVLAKKWRVVDGDEVFIGAKVKVSMTRARRR